MATSPCMCHFSVKKAADDPVIVATRREQLVRVVGATHHRGRLTHIPCVPSAGGDWADQYEPKLRTARNPHEVVGSARTEGWRVAAGIGGPGLLRITAAQWAAGWDERCSSAERDISLHQRDRHQLAGALPRRPPPPLPLPPTTSHPPQSHP